MGSHFLAKTQVDLAACLEVDGALALDRYPALAAFLARAVSPEAAALFAEPLISRGNREAPPTVAWYGDVEGEAKPLTALEGPARSEADATLARLLGALRGVLDDPDGGRLVGAALHVPQLDDVLVVRGRPVVVNWGMLAAPGAGAASARAAQYARTFGRYLPLAGAPPLFAGDQVGAPRPAAAPQVPTAVAPVEAPRPAPTTAAPPPAQPTRRAWVPLAVLLLLAAAVLVWLLLPGTRRFPERLPEDVSAAEAAGVADAVAASLRERRDTLRAALDGAQCRDDGTLVLPGGRTMEGLLPPMPGAPDAAPGSRAAADPAPTLPAPVQRVVVAGGGTDEGQTLIEVIEQRTAMIVAGGDGVSTASGFFVAPDLVVTNFHAVEGAAPDQLFVTNRDLGALRAARVIASLGPFDATGADFALLQVDGAAQPFFPILDPPGSLKLQAVIAAGYPGDILAGDAQYAALMRGDAGAVPELSVTDGLVNTEQTVPGRSRLVVHSAPISRGNSGGPLVDFCGRVVGVNTFVRQGELRNLNFALASTDLLAFLGTVGTRAAVVTEACAPQVLRPAAPPPVVAATAPPGLPALPGLPAPPQTNP